MHKYPFFSCDGLIYISIWTTSRKGDTYQPPSQMTFPSCHLMYLRQFRRAEVIWSCLRQQTSLLDLCVWKGVAISGCSIQTRMKNRYFCTALGKSYGISTITGCSRSFFLAGNKLMFYLIGKHFGFIRGVKRFRILSMEQIYLPENQYRNACDHMIIIKYTSISLLLRS